MRPISQTFITPGRAFFTWHDVGKPSYLLDIVPDNCFLIRLNNIGLAKPSIAWSG